MACTLSGIVPWVLVAVRWIGPGLQEPRPWLLLALTSTFAGNLTLFGSIANVIVFETARVHVGFWEFLRIGAPLTALTTAAGVALLLSGAKEVEDAITRLLGLRQEAFCSTVLLPQGRYDLCDVGTMVGGTPGRLVEVRIAPHFDHYGGRARTHPVPSDGQVHAGERLVPGRGPPEA